MKQYLKYIFLPALAAFLISCGVDELNTVFPGGEEDGDEMVEFVATITPYTKTLVKTKSIDTGFEADIYSAFLLLFDSSGNLLYDPIAVPLPEGTTQFTTFSYSVPKPLLQSASKAAFVTNVTADQIGTYNANESKTLSTLIVKDLNYKVVDESIVPCLGQDGPPAIPMFGVIDAPSATNSSITLTRLFAKVEVNLSMNLTDPGTINSNSHFELTSYYLNNLPGNVKLDTYDDKESAWKNGTDNNNIPGLINGSYKIDNESSYLGSNKQHTFTCYVPEYHLNPKTSLEGNGAPEYKPKNWPNDTKPIYLTLSGNYKPISGDTKPVTYNIYLGENASTSYTLNRNKYYVNYIVIKGFVKQKDGKTEDSTLDHRVEIKEKVETNFDGESANCYIIGAGGDWSILAYQGAFKGIWNPNETNPKCTPSTYATKNPRVEIIAADMSSANDNFVLNDNNSRFELSNEGENEPYRIKFTVSDDFSEGNVIIAFKYTDEGAEKTAWSWHLWFVSGLPILNTEWFTLDNQLHEEGNYLMDRNLGSNGSLYTSLAPGTVTGLYYKYGSKNPYFVDKYNNADNTTGAYYGTTDASGSSWVWTGTGKSPTDPCPPGYKVPNSSVWSSMGSKSTIYDAYLYSGDDNALNNTIDIYYPFLDNSIVDKTYFSRTYRHSGTYVDEIKSNNIVTDYPHYKNIKYYIDITYLSGSLLASDNQQFIYEAAGQGLLSDIQITEYESKTTRYSDWKKTTVSNNSIGATVMNLLLESIKSPIEESISDILNKTQKKDASASYGYQVRCVKE